MKTVLLIPDGVGVRNFLLTRFLSEVSGLGSVDVLHVFDDNVVAASINGTAGDVRWMPLLRVREKPVSSTLRYALAYAQMYWADTRAMRYLRQWPIKGSWRTRAMHRAARALGRAAASRTGIRSLERCHSLVAARLPEVDHYTALLRRLSPSVLFCSHQRPPSVIPPVLAAKRLAIPTVTFIFSWDNLSSKGRFAAPFDHFLVWSDQMRRELLQYYPDVRPENVHVVGTPQFDPYAYSGLLWPRERFFQQLGLDPARPVICYTGGDTTTCPDDPLHLATLMRLIRSGAIAGAPQVLVRPAPVDTSDRYSKVLREFPEVRFARPSWVRTSPDEWTHVVPLRDDVEFLVNLTHHSTLNVNVASTMTLDFAIHDRPVVNIGFDESEPPPFGVPLHQMFYEFEHYRPVVELQAARLAKSPAELAAHVNAYLADPSLDRDGRRRFVELEVGVPVGGSSREIAAALGRIAAAAAAHN